jgi:exonuclease III
VITRLSLLNRNFTIVGVYAPREGKEHETEEFYNELQLVIDKTPKKENIITAGDFNGRTGNQPIPECIGQNRECVINYSGTALRDFSAFNKLKITNSFYRHKNMHKFTWEARGSRSIIDYIIINDRLKSNIEDTGVVRGSEIDSDHKLVGSRSGFTIRVKHYSKERDKTIHKKPVGFKAYLLEQESVRTL